MSDDGGRGENPFAYVLIPVIGFGVIVAVISCYRFRRKKQRLAQMVADPAYEGRLEAGQARLGHAPNGVIIVANGQQGEGGGGGGRGRGGRSRRLGLGAGLGSREEGLNELGEAPPAYMPSAPKPPSDGGVENIELMSYSQATAAVGTSRSPPLYGEEPLSATGAGTVTEPTSSTGDAAMASEGTGGDTGNATTEAVTTGQNQAQGRGQSPPRYGEVASAETTSTAAVTDTTAAPSTADEPTAPPRAVLPSS